MDDDGVVTDAGGEFVAAGVGAKQERDDDEGIFFCDEAAAGLHFADLQAELGDGSFEFAIAFRTEAFDGVFIIGFFEPGFPA